MSTLSSSMCPSCWYVCIYSSIITNIVSPWMNKMSTLNSENQTLNQLADEPHNQTLEKGSVSCSAMDTGVVCHGKFTKCWWSGEWVLVPAVAFLQRAKFPFIDMIRVTFLYEYKNQKKYDLYYAF